jgi:hypothetical protein
MDRYSAIIWIELAIMEEGNEGIGRITGRGEAVCIIILTKHNST